MELYVGQDIEKYIFNKTAMILSMAVFMRE